MAKDDLMQPLDSRRRLATELRRARDRSGLSGRDLAERIGISQSKVSRIEQGMTIPSAPEVAAWAAAVEAPAGTVELLEALTEAVFTEVHRWGPALRNRGHIQDDIREVEERARAVAVFEPSVVPGLLQTAEYAKRVMAYFQPAYAPSDLSAAVAARLDRQTALFDPARCFRFLITEAALRWRPGPPALLLAQLDRIGSLSTLENVSIGLIPQAMEAVTYVPHGFVLFDLPGDGDAGGMAMAETIHANLVVRGRESVALYRKQWSLLELTALTGMDARRFLAGLGAELREVEP